MAKETINGLGRRKTAVARVYLKSGKGTFIVNGKDLLKNTLLKTIGRQSYQTIKCNRIYR
jgi:ribosomal protein S9